MVIYGVGLETCDKMVNKRYRVDCLFAGRRWVLYVSMDDTFNAVEKNCGVRGGDSYVEGIDVDFIAPC